MNQGYFRKAVFRDRMNLEAFSRKYGVGMGRSFLFTITFKDNILSKSDASSYLNVLLTTIRRFCPIFHYICVAERQKRGAWHFHLLCSSPLSSLSFFKREVSRFISSSSLPLGFYHCKWTTGNDFRGVSFYLTKYFTKLEKREPGIRYVSYSRGFDRVCSLPFSWVGGSSMLWRSRCQKLDALYPSVFAYFYKNSSFDEKLLVLKLPLAEDQSFSDLSLSADSALISWIDRHAPVFYKNLLDNIFYGRGGDILYDVFDRPHLERVVI